MKRAIIIALLAAFATSAKAQVYQLDKAITIQVEYIKIIPRIADSASVLVLQYCDADGNEIPMYETTTLTNNNLIRLYDNKVTKLELKAILPQRIAVKSKTKK